MRRSEREGMAGSQTLRFDVVGDASSAARAFKSTADSAAVAARSARQLSDGLKLQSKSAQVSADATLALAKSDSILRDAQLTLAGATDDASGSLGTLRRRLDDLSGKVASARVSLAGDKEAQARLDAINVRLTDLDHKTATPSLDVQGIARAAAELSAVDVALDKVGGSGIRAGGDLESLGSSLGKLSNVGMPALIGAGVALSPVLVTVGTGLGGLALAAKSTVGPILQAGTATTQAQQALKSLDPAQKAAYQSLGALKTQFSGFSKELQPEVLGIFNKGLGVASTLLGDIEPVAKATGDALSVVVGDIGADLKTEQWREFFGFLSAQAGPDIKLLGQLFVDTLNDIPPLIEGLQPLAQGLLEIGDIAAKTIGPLAKAISIFTSPTGSATAFANSGTAATGAAGDFAKLAQQAQKAADQVGKAGGAASQAAPQVGTLAGDMALLNTSTTSAATAAQAFNDAWKQIVGNSLSDQQAVLADESAFDSLTSAVKSNGAQSLQARTAFVSYMQQIGSSISTLEQNGASAAQVNAAYETNIKRLQSLHNLTPQQRADVQGLIKDYDTWASSTAGLNRQTLTAAQSIKDQFTVGLKALGEFTPKVNTDVNSLASAVLRTGTTSSATRGDRAALIRDLENAGFGAQSAAKLVDGLERKIGGLRGKKVDVGADVNPAITALRNLQRAMARLHDKTVTVTVQQSDAISAGFAGVVRTGRLAAGGRITAGTTPTADDVLVRVSRGETVVSAATSARLAPVFAAHGVPGYASGGVPAQVIPGGRSGGGEMALRIAGPLPGGSALQRMFLDWLQDMSARGQLKLVTG